MNLAAHAMDWIEQVDAILIGLDEHKPQFEASFSLDWKRVEEDLRRLFQFPDLTLSHTVRGWVDGKELWKAGDQNLYSLAIDWQPLSEPAYFLTSSHDLKQLMSELVGGEKAASFFFEPGLLQGFYHYFTAEVLNILTTHSFAAPLSPRIGQFFESVREPIDDRPFFVIDLAMSFGGKTCVSRVLLSSDFQKAWKKYFERLPREPLAENIKKNISIDLSLEVGYVHLKLKEFREIHVGDFVILDYCSYDPMEQKGGIVITLNQQPIFRGKIKEGGVKVTQYPLYNEVNTMEEKSFDFEDEEDEDEDEEDEDEDLDDDDDDDFDEIDDEEIEEKNLVEEEVSGEKGPSISLGDVPVQLIVEIGRVRITAQELMNLAPGNLLDIHVNPEQGVDLIVNGKKVGRGELIRMGETLGVRILNF